ncbi:permease [Natranaerofaba carboxydovora]|uniref:permease n=1 Tax=Natranaerofaba carboxydovora TaxID=2742683 RepID=UPI001F144E42|nr:permease [Natranaerofaba carboxydovora]UMZ72780.1 putative permease [Natranaerofaba carboxydovora]
MLLPTLFFVIVAIVLIVLNSKKGRHRTGLKSGAKQLAAVLPVILIAFMLAGMIEVIIPEEFVKQWLAREAGFRGVILGTIGGSLLAMGPYASFPIIASIFAAGAGLGTVVSLIFAWCLLGLSRLPYELGFFGPRFAIARLSLSVPFCLLAGVIAHVIELILY